MAGEEQVDVAEQIQYIKGLIDTTEAQIQVLSRALEDMIRARSILEDASLRSSKSLRVSIGAGIYVDAKLNLEEKVMVPIGSDTYIQESAEDAVKRLKSNEEEVKDSLGSFTPRGMSSR
ncbi:prefoldin subunit alpha [Thermogymnomonas acidicola]|uniref:prefoldin subunit alpha n=1 Tax=Thermogymnomonas acidicola TaxID=399579 RepID=UPI001396C105|nr:prefoldin subunit alpha [Thermogymnomonas acidicola]